MLVTMLASISENVEMRCSSARLNACASGDASDTAPQGLSSMKIGAVRIERQPRPRATDDSGSALLRTTTRASIARRTLPSAGSSRISSTPKPRVTPLLQLPATRTVFTSMS